MTTPIRDMSCDQFAETLADFLEREVPEGMRATMESHALSCDDCGPLLADLRKLRIDAANLDVLVPSRDLWAGIAERIETPVVSIGGAATGGPVNRWTGGPARRIWMGLAAAGLVAITATVTHQITKRTLSVPTQTVAALTPIQAVLSTPAPDSAAVERSTGQPVHRSTAKAPLSLASNKLTPEQTYDVEISRLRKIVNARRGELDSVTVAVLEKNMKIIDDAIAQCRLALIKDPASAYLNESLTDALDNKVQLLRTAAGLPTRM
jgi:hypothetical protein